MQDSFARARTRPSARATIGYLVYKKCPESDLERFLVQFSSLHVNLVQNRARIELLHSYKIGCAFCGDIVTYTVEPL